MTRPLVMRVNMTALEHLGINLYSTIPAVLSEVVANSWDADATAVEIRLDQQNRQIVISDNGLGMTRDEVIDRFLTVGYQRRVESKDATEKLARPPMGRKGIGKLSSFSIAQKVSVFTAKNGDRTAFAMDVERIKESIETNPEEPYFPDEINDWPADIQRGTRIILSELQNRMTKLTDKALRQRLSRRFSIIGGKNQFTVTVNGTEISPSDRGYYDHVEYLWTLGNMENWLPLFTNLADEREPENREGSIAEKAHSSGIVVSGWVGTVENSGTLKDEDGENLNRVAVFMRGKLAQEDILDDFGHKEIFADYLVGEIHCDDLDNDGDPDIATSSRQALKYDDPRFEALREIVQEEIFHIRRVWTPWRRTDKTRKLVGMVPEVLQWLDELQGDTKGRAERWIGRLNVIRSDRDREKRELLKASILAFESYRRKEQLDFLENLTDESIEPILQVFNDIDDLELSYYGQIVKLRLGVISALEEKLDKNDKETVIRDHIYNHLWLVDPGWERVKGTEAAERNMTNFLRSNSDSLSPEERRGRIDIGYRTVQGSHVIIELKRASVSTPVDQLASQIRKYRDGARHILGQGPFPEWPLDILCLVGTPPPEWDQPGGPSDVRETLATVNARLVFYDHLLGNSQQAYADYLEEHKKVDRLWRIFQGIDDFTLDSE